MAIRIQLRRDTAANWVSANPVLRSGEAGIETDTLKIKIGDGSTPWNSITTYANITPSQFSSLNTDSVSEGSTNKYFTDERAQDAIAAALAAGTHTNITVSYDDSTNSISLTGAQTYSDENAVDAVAQAIANGTQTNIAVTYDDLNNSLSFNASGGVSSLTGTANEVDVSASTGAVTVGLPNDVTISNNLTVTGDISAADSLQLTTNAAETSSVGKLFWDDGEGTASLGLKGGNVVLQLGQENITLCYNGTGSAIPNGSVVYISGAQGQRPSLALADADSEATSSKTFGIATETIADGEEGFVSTFGVVNGIDTSGFTAGSALWLSSTPGLMTTTKPSAPTHTVFIGYCLHVNASSGRVFVNPQNGYELDELHDVAITSVANNDVLKYDSTTSTWKNTKVLSIQDLTLSGNLTVNGTTTTVNTSDLVVSDPLIYMGEGNTANSVDLGIVSSFNDGTYQHTGLVRDASDNKWKLFKGVTDEPTSTVNFGQGSLDGLAVGALEATSITVGDVSNTEFGYLNGVTSGIQSQIDAKASTTDLSTHESDTSTHGVTGAIVGTTDTQTLTNKSISLTTNTVSGTISEFNSALSGADFATLAGTETLTNKTISGSSNTISNIGNSSLTNSSITINGSAVSLGGSVTIDALPSQTGNSGEYLTTDGSTASWAPLVVPITTGTATITANTATGVDSFIANGGTAIEYMITLLQGSKMRTSKVLLHCDGNSVDTTEFAIMELGGSIAGVAVTGSISASAGSLNVTVTDAASTNVTVKFSKVLL